MDLRRCDDPRAMLRLQASCEAAKIQLSKTLEASFSIDYLWPGQPSWEGRITRQQFELINEDFFRQCLRQTAKSLKDAHLDVDSVDDIVLVGGSTRIPKVISPSSHAGRAWSANLAESSVGCYVNTMEAVCCFKSAPFIKVH